MTDQLERLARDFVASQLEVDDLEGRLKQRKAENQALRLKLYEAITTQANMRSYPHSELGTFVPMVQTFAGIKKAALDDEGDVVDEFARQELENWSHEQLDSTGHALFEDLFYQAVKHPRLSALVREYIEEGKELPPGTQYRTQPNIRWMRPDEMKKQVKKSSAGKETVNPS